MNRVCANVDSVRRYDTGVAIGNLRDVVNDLERRQKECDELDKQCNDLVQAIRNAQEEVKRVVTSDACRKRSATSADLDGLCEKTSAVVEECKRLKKDQKVLKA